VFLEVLLIGGVTVRFLRGSPAFALISRGGCPPEPARHHMPRSRTFRSLRDYGWQAIALASALVSREGCPPACPPELEERRRESSPRGLCRPIEDDCDWLLEAATLGRNGEKPLPLRRHREVAPRCPLGHGEERCRRSELEHRRRPDGHRYEMPVVCEIEELPSGRVSAWNTPPSRRYS